MGLVPDYFAMQGVEFVSAPVGMDKVLAAAATRLPRRKAGLFSRWGLTSCAKLLIKREVWR